MTLMQLKTPLKANHLDMCLTSKLAMTKQTKTKKMTKRSRVET